MTKVVEDLLILGVWFRPSGWQVAHGSESVQNVDHLSPAGLSKINTEQATQNGQPIFNLLEHLHSIVASEGCSLRCGPVRPVSTQ